MINLIQPITVQQAMMGLLTHGGEHHEIGDGGWLTMMMASGALNGLQISPPEED